MLLYSSDIINNIDETKRSESAYFHHGSNNNCLSRENTQSSKNSLDVRDIPSPPPPHPDDSDSGINEDSGSVKVCTGCPPVNTPKIFP